MHNRTPGLQAGRQGAGMGQWDSRLKGNSRLTVSTNADKLTVTHHISDEKGLNRS
jgi:hypothetical protein